MRKLGLLFACVAVLFIGCGKVAETQSVSGIKEAIAEVQTGSDGLTSEQRNIKERIKRDNKPGAIKHLYIISASSGQCILYSTVKEKVTSSGKRLSPTSVTSVGYYKNDSTRTGDGFAFKVGGSTAFTKEMLQDDGTYGSSIEYLYWFDSKGIFHQFYPGAGALVHVSDQPIPMKSVIINIEQR